MMGNLQKAAQLLGMELLPFDAHAADDFDAAFTTMTQKRVDALFVFGDVLFGVHRARLTEFAVTGDPRSILTGYTSMRRSHVYAASFPEYLATCCDLC